jgi:CheY-like chemotaxis protein
MPRLLLVDDNLSIHKIVVSLLGKTGIELTCTHSSVEAFGLVIRESPFDLALIDTSLPEMDGWELMARLRGYPKTANLPIAMMAGVLEDLDPAKVEYAPIQALLRKPVDLSGLAEKVEALMAVPVMTDRQTPMPQDIPSDLLILDEQDLIEPDATGFQDDAKVPSNTPSDISGSTADESFTLELEDLDIHKDDSAHTNAITGDLADSETTPEDFAGAIPSRKDTEAATKPQDADESSDDVPDGLYDALQREFEQTASVTPDSEQHDAPPAPDDEVPQRESVLSGEVGQSEDIKEDSSEPSPTLPLDDAPAEMPVPEPDMHPSTAASLNGLTELLSNPAFIDAIAEAVAKKIKPQ